MSTILACAGPGLSNTSTGNETFGSSTQGLQAGGSQPVNMPLNSAITTFGQTLTSVASLVSSGGNGLPPLAGSNSVSGGMQYTQLRFLPSTGFVNANLVANLNMCGGKDATTSWYINLWTIGSGQIPADSAATSLFFFGPNSPCPGSGTDCLTSATTPTLTGGFQPIYLSNSTAATVNGGTIPWVRFAQNTGTGNGTSVVDLVMSGGKDASAGWYMVVYSVSGGVLT